jgi:hypothetical protein
MSRPIKAELPETARPTQGHNTARNDAMLLVGIFTGPVVWAADHTISYALVPHACSTGHHYVLHLATALSLLLTLGGFFLAMSSYNRLARGAHQDGDSIFDRDRFMSILGMAMSIAFCIVIIASAIPRFMLDPCVQ